MPFGGIHPPHPQNDGENHHEHHNNRANVRSDPGGGAGSGYDFEGGNDGLELERDVGSDAYQGNDRDQCGNGLGSSVAGGDEIGDAGEPAGIPEVDQSPQDGPPEHDGNGRAKIHGQEKKARGGRLAHAAVVGPGRAIDCQGKRVHVGIIGRASARRRFPLDPEGYQKQDRQVEAEDRQHDSGIKHRLPSVADGRRRKPIPARFCSPGREAGWQWPREHRDRSIKPPEALRERWPERAS